MTAVLFLLGLMIRLAPLPDIEAEKAEEITDSHLTEKRTIFAFPHLILGVLALFFYVGAEVIAGDTIIRYGISIGIPIDTAKAFTTYTLVAMVAGYILGIFLIPKVISQRLALQASAVLGFLFSLAALFSGGGISVFFIAILGLANALVWPAIWPLAIHDLGKFIKTGSALLIMAIAGGAILPVAWGYLADRWTSQNAYWILVPCYIVIGLYASYWYKLRSWKR
jgi:fucose permease